MPNDEASFQAREEQLRRKEKEIARKEQTVKEQVLHAQTLKLSMDAALQELEARELVMNDAEQKHGSLLQREEVITRRERDTEAKEDALRERLVEATKRDQEAADYFRQRQREYEEKLFPLAAREQELLRREAEAQAMDHDLELKYKTLNRHVASEEEKEKSREKTFRDREQQLRDLMAATDRRQQEQEQTATHLNEKQRLLKAEQLESDGRDRELKWREDNCRAAQHENADLKAKLVQWEGSLAVKEESVQALLAQAQLKLAELELKDTIVAEKTAKLLAMDQAAQDRETSSAQAEAAAKAVAKRVEQEQQKAQAESERLAKVAQDLSQREAGIASQEKKLQEWDEKLRHLQTSLEDRERGIKAWVLELQYREQQQQQGGATHNGDGGSAGMGPSSDGGGGVAPGDVAGRPLEDVQFMYLRGAKRVLATTSSLKTSSSQGGGGSSAEASNSSEAVADALALESLRRQLESRFDALCTALYGLPESEKRQAGISAEDEESARRCDARYRERKRELAFFWSTLIGQKQSSALFQSSGSGSGSADGGDPASRMAKELVAFGSKYTAADWSDYYWTIRREASGLRDHTVKEMIALLQEQLDCLEPKLSESLGQQSKTREELVRLNGAQRIHRQALSRALPVGGAHRRVSSMNHNNNSNNNNAKLAQRATSPPSHNDEGESGAAGGGTQYAQTPPAVTESAALKKKKELYERVAATLPAYLRHYYSK